MADHIIIPSKSRWERWKDGINGITPQVKSAIIAAAVALLALLITTSVAWMGASSENSRLRTKVHDLELEIAPFRNLAVQEFRSADATSLKKLAELMTTLRADYATQLNTVNSLRAEIERLKESEQKASAQVAQQNFVPIAEGNKVLFVSQLKGFLQRWPGITNIGLIVDGTEKKRRLWASQLQQIIAEEKLPMPLSAGLNMEKGAYDLVIFYDRGMEKAAEELALPFGNLFRIPLTIYHRTNEPNPITVRLMGDPLFETNGVIHFK